MSAVEEIMANLPMDQLAQQLGAEPSQVSEAVQATLPALLGGLQANAQDPAGAASLTEALGNHDAGLAAGPIDLGAVDTADGQKIASNVFGGNQDEVASRLGGVGGGSNDLIKKLIPLLAPIVLSYLAGKLGSKGEAAQGSTGGGGLGQVLSEMLGGSGHGAAPAGGGSIIADVLGGLLGGGRR